MPMKNPPQPGRIYSHGDYRSRWPLRNRRRGASGFQVGIVQLA